MTWAKGRSIAWGLAAVAGLAYGYVLDTPEAYGVAAVALIVSQLWRAVAYLD